MCAVLLAVLLGAVLARREPRTLVIDGATLWDGTGAASVPDSVVVVRGERIACAGPRPSCTEPAGARRIDARGLWLVPGLVDTHVHLDYRFAPDRARLAQAVRFAYGITTVREMSTHGMLGPNLALRRETRSARVPLPRLYVSGRVSPEEIAENRAPDERALTRSLANVGVDGIKLKGANADIFTGIIEAAHAAGLPAYGHTGQYARRKAYTVAAVRAGLDGVVHLDDVALELSPYDDAGEAAFLSSLAPRRTRVDTALRWSVADRAREDALLALMISHGTWLEPTLLGVTEIVEPERVPEEVRSGRPRHLPPMSERSWRSAHEGMARMRDFVRRFHEAGGLVISGTDGWIDAGPDLVAELCLLEPALGRRGALLAATRDAARALRRQDRIGTVQAGRLADLVLLGGDPLADLRNLLRVRWVVKGGIPYPPHAPARLRSPLAPEHEDE